MIAVKRLLRLIRYKQQDNNEIKFSDYDLLQAINECVRYINQSFALKNSDFLERIKRFRQGEINEAIEDYNENLPEGELPKELVDFVLTGVALPEDFISLVGIVRVSDGYHLSPVAAIDPVMPGTYKIFGGRLYLSSPVVDVLYRAQIASVKDLNGVVELPEVFTDCLVKVSGLILNNAETDVLAQAVRDNIDCLVPGRRYSNVKARMPFYV